MQKTRKTESKRCQLLYSSVSPILQLIHVIGEENECN